ncbi:hypothetical protein CHH91_03510 [Virgibacillus sp. 7505]|nr:hypothetical protein CHH91_03510 [Virgibacillus sp. 7505]
MYQINGNPNKDVNLPAKIYISSGFCKAKSLLPKWYSEGWLLLSTSILVISQPHYSTAFVYFLGNSWVFSAKYFLPYAIIGEQFKETGKVSYETISSIVIWA